MAFSLEDKLVVAIASSALFDLRESNDVFERLGPAEYRKYQRAHENEVLGAGVAFNFIRRLLSFNAAPPAAPQVEVILLSRNDSDTGQRVMNSIENRGLGISRAAFLKGDSPHLYLGAFNVRLFLSGNESDVPPAIHPAS